MKLVRGIKNILLKNNRCVLTIGNFDSVHRGHQKILNILKKISKTFQLPTIVMIFEPQPLEYFMGISAPSRITSLRDKIKYISKYKIDYLLCVKFDHDFSLLTAEQFVLKFLVKKLKIKFLAVGDDFRFGKNREGDLKYLNKIKNQYDFKIINIRTLYNFGSRVSSTSIRNALLNANFKLAEHLMGHSYRLSGRVIHGRQIGSLIGFPTANIDYRALVLPLKGVYIVEVYGLSNKPLEAVANIGTCPTFNGINKKVEVYIIDKNINIYGRCIEIIFRKKLRNEKKFNSLEKLKNQIYCDIISARNFFRNYKRIQ
ncbi:MAG: bifunctional riboflavin kinase/FAD synthetase [Arsenophonus sp.]|nr:MAG: bifunctional riboflavin kinase/FAD synthetase [Arsenophonus sp.]